MKTIHTITIIALAAITLGCASDKAGKADENEVEQTDPSTITSGKYEINSRRSKLIWKGSMVKLGGSALYHHTGMVSVAGGEVAFENGNLTYANVTFNMEKIWTTDDNYEDNADKKKLIEHLQSDDFFATDKFPVAKFSLNSISKGTATGTLALHGEKKDIGIRSIGYEVRDSILTISGKTLLNRQEFGIAFKGNFEDKIISDEVEIQFELVGIEK